VRLRDYTVPSETSATQGKRSVSLPESQLEPGCHVKLKAQLKTTNLVTVEIKDRLTLGPKKQDRQLIQNLANLNALDSVDFSQLLSPTHARRTSTYSEHYSGPNFGVAGERTARASQDGHGRGTSDTYKLNTSTQTSLMLHSSNSSGSDVGNLLRRGGYLPGTYPSNHFLKNISRFARFAVASYGSSFLRLTGAVSNLDGVPVQQDPAHLAEHQSFSSYARLPPSTVLLFSFVDPHGGTNAAGETDTGMPLVHYISLDHDSKAVVLTCRGTLGFEDVLTDMTCDYDNLIWRGKAYQVHKGMYASARRLLTMHGGRVVVTLKAALEKYEYYGLVFCGHSLGGGVVSVLAIMLAQANTTSAGSVSAFVTASQPLSLSRKRIVSRMKSIGSPPCRQIDLSTFTPMVRQQLFHHRFNAQPAVSSPPSSIAATWFRISH